MHQAATSTASTGSSRVSSRRVLGLDDLAALEPEALLDLYRDARVPALDAVRGDLEGRMLASPWVNGPAASAIRAFAGSRLFPWKGKSFRALGPDRGEGINRVISDARRWFRFDTFVGKSRAGDFDAVQLDYDNPSNPFFIRAIKDEIRELSPGLYLGQAWLRLRGQEHLGLYFALAQSGRL